MEVWKICLIAAGASAAVTLLILLLRAKAPKGQNDEQILISCFGNPVLTDVFTYQQAKQWLLQRRNLIESGQKGIVLKASPEALKTLGSQYDLNLSADNYAVMAIVNMQTHEITESVLIKYNSLDDELEQKLSVGNGIMVIGG